MEHAYLITFEREAVNKTGKPIKNYRSCAGLIYATRKVAQEACNKHKAIIANDKSLGRWCGSTKPKVVKFYYNP